MDTLIEYGHSFQQKFIAALISDKDYLHQIIDILDETQFDSDANVTIVKIIKDYFFGFGNVPTLEVFSLEVKKLNNEVLKASVIENLKGIFKQIQSASDLDYIKQEALSFFTNQNLKHALIDSVDLLEINKFDEIRVRLDKAFKAGQSKKTGHDYKKDVKKRYEEDNRNPLKTGMDPIDEITDGGLGAGDLGVICGLSGSGKSWSLVNIGAHAVKQGKFVVYYTLELLDTYVSRRFDAFYTGITPASLKYHIEDVEEATAALPGELMVQYYPTKNATINTIDSHIQLLKLMYNKTPDLILLDYADLLKPISTGKQLRTDEELGNIYEELRGLGGKYGCPTWTVSQAQRSQSNEDVIQSTGIQGAYSKVFVADLVLTLSRKVEDKISGTGRWHVAKNRYGPDGLTFPSKINFATGRMTLYEAESDTGKDLKKDMDNGGEVTRKYLKNKFQELGGK